MSGESAIEAACAEEVIGRSPDASPSADARRLAIAATFTAEPLAESVAFWLDELRLPFALEFASFNQVFQQLLDRSSLLATNHRGFNVFLIRIEDLGAFDTEGATAELQRRLDELVLSMKSSQATSVCPSLVCICPPSRAPHEYAEWSRDYLRAEEYLLGKLRTVDGLKVVRHQDIAARHPGIETTAPQRTHGHIPYTREYFATLGTTIVRTLHAIERNPAKVLVLDCDNTLWRGVSAEDGATSVIVDDSCRAIQQFALRQRAAGVLICLCSKNVEEDVVEVLDGHPDMLLRREHVSAWRVNWEPKSTNLRALAEELKLGLDSLVLLDDSAVECAEVRAHAPEVLTLTLPEDRSRIPSFLEHVWAFEGVARTSEDAKRSEYYRQDAERERLRVGAYSFADFIAGLNLQIDLLTPGPDQIPRVAQLTQRTNQFNNTTQRRSAQEIQRLIESSGGECIVAQVRDRFGDYGLVGVALCSTVGGRMLVDGLMMSCRALGRGVEHRLLARVGERALARGLQFVDVPYVPTRKNRPVLQFLQSLDAEVDQRTDGSKIFRMASTIAAGLSFEPLDGAGVDVDVDIDAEPVRAAVLGSELDPQHRVTSEQWQGVAAELSLVSNLLHRIDRKRLRPRPETAYALVAPRTDEERRLAELWADALGIDRVGIHDDFFEFGGTSLQAALLVNTLQQRLQRRFDNVIVFEAPTVAALTAHLRTHADSAGLALTSVSRTPRDRHFAPASSAQQRLWFLDRFSPGHHQYNERRAFRLSGPVEVSELGDAVAALVARHESLRTTFSTVGGKAVQVIDSTPFAGLEVLDLRSVSSEAREADAPRHLAAQVARTFDLSLGPLFRAGLRRGAHRGIAR